MCCRFFEYLRLDGINSEKYWWQYNDQIKNHQKRLNWIHKNIFDAAD